MDSPDDSTNEDRRDNSWWMKYRRDYESDEQWNMKKAFLKTFAAEISEDELASLAQAFMNIEISNCKYPMEIGERIQELASQVPEVKAYRQRRLTRAQEKSNMLQAKEASNLISEDWESEDKEEILKIWNEPKLNFIEDQPNNLRGLLKDVVYFEIPNDNEASLIRTNAFMKKVGHSSVEFRDNKCFYRFKGKDVGQGVGNSKKEAKSAVEEDFRSALKANCFTITQINPQRDEIDKVLLVLSGKFPSDRIDDIKMQITISRGDLTDELSDKLDQSLINNLLATYGRIQTEYDLIFSHDLTKEERKSITDSANRLKLRTKLFGRKNSRHVVIQSRITAKVLRQKLLEGDQRWLNKYEIAAPPSKKKVDKKNWKKIDTSTPERFFHSIPPMVNRRFQNSRLEFNATNQ